jgi:type IV pilus assembly protein PilY1
MKTIAHLAISLVALGAVMSGAASAATPVAELPLKTSVLAKPNVIFGMDDSGSMDWETLLDTNSGVLWWDGATAWGDGASMRALRTSNNEPYPYLFPMGTATGGQIYSGSPASPGLQYSAVLPPTNQFAWMRSNAFNPIYYNTMVTYPHWSPAYFSGSLKTYSDMSPTAARSHPAVSTSQTINLTTQWTSTSSSFMFFLQGGMIVPAGSYLQTSSNDASGTPCSGSTWRTTTADQTVPASSSCMAAIPYYPATFWHRETCTVGANCINAPDGTGTLKRYEIKSTVSTYPSGRTYAAEMQNFANWFSYYRKRKLMLAGSMGRVLENISGLRLGNLAFNENITIAMHDADSTNAADNRLAAAGEYYLNAMTSNGTPTHQTVKNIAAQFNTKLSGSSSIVQYACQRNNMFIVTDGFSNTTSISVPTYNAATFGGSAPYTTTPSGSLADLALSYYTNRLRTDLPAGKLPASSSTAPNADLNTNLHINTYAITLGVRGSLWPNTADPFVTAPAWPTPVADDPSMIDDQWHATINGRGQMYLATTPDETAASIKAGLDDILSQVSAQGALAVSTVNLARGDSRAYLGVYNPAGWAGDLQAVPVNPDTGVVGGATLWSVQSKLQPRAWNTRVIASWSGSAGTSFSAAAVGAAVNPGATWGVTGEVIDYLRGDRSNEGTKFRTRKSLLGAVINGEPVVDRDTGVVYFTSGEGMLHAVDTVGSAGGTELWAYVPGQVLPDIGQTVARSYSFKTQLDGSPVIRKIGSTKLLVSNMGAAGRGYFAMDVTSPRGLDEAGVASKALWEFPAASDTTTKAKVGQTLGRAAIVRNSANEWVVLVTSGYNNTYDGQGRLWVLNATTGAVINEYVNGAGSLSAESGLAHVSPFAESDGTVRYVYGGDLLGNLWRFDLTLSPGSTSAVTKVAQLRGPTGAVQPVTTPPELLMSKGQRIVYVGTGRLLDVTDFGSSAVESMYAIADGALLTNARSNLVQQTYNPSGSGTLTTSPVDWTTQRGWFVDFPAGEQANTRPIIAYGSLTFATNTTGASDCSASARVYIIDVLTGGQFKGADLVSWAISTTSNVSSIAALMTRSGNKLWITAREYNNGSGSSGIPSTPSYEACVSGAATAGCGCAGSAGAAGASSGSGLGGICEKVGDGIKPAKNSWQEIRRQ